MYKNGVPPDVIEKILIEAKAEEQKSSDTTLSIGSVVHELIENWLKNHSNKCPVCREEVAKGHPINL